MKASEIKPFLLRELLFGGHHAVFTEVEFADVFGVTRSKYTHELEIKVSKADLMSELNCIKDLTLFGTPQKRYAKKYKHEHYFKGETNMFVEVPNYFSFVTPFNLEKLALEILKDTKYGLYCINIHENGGNPYATIGCQKKAQLLHKEKISEKKLFYLLRKASTEVQFLREKAIKQKQI